MGQGPRHAGEDAASNPEAEDTEREAQRAVLELLLRHEQTTQWQLIDLLRELEEAHPSATHPSAAHRALHRLEEAMVIYRSGPFIWETGAVRHLRRLGLIDI